MVSDKWPDSRPVLVYAQRGHRQSRRGVYSSKLMPVPTLNQEQQALSHTRKPFLSTEGKIATKNNRGDITYTAEPTFHLHLCLSKDRNNS